MNTTEIVRAWKQTEGSASMASVAGMPVVDEELLRQVGGGRGEHRPEFSSGFVCTISGECNGGTSCWPF